VYIVYIVLRGSSRYAELAPGEVETAQLLVEALVSVILLQIFPAIRIDLVEIVYQPDLRQ
jgi:hypothetical protein